MKGNRGRSKVQGLPIALVFCCVSFLAGFFGSVLLFKDSSGGAGPRLRRTEAEEEFPAMPHGDSGESRPSSIPFQILSWKPRVLYFPKFATAEQCQGVIEMSKSRLKPSKLALREGETAENTKGVRTSTGTYIHSSEDPTGILDQIEQKMARATMIPRAHGEEFNILRYEIGQSYASHYDAFSPAEYGPQESQRMATFLLYLSDVEEGGETIFPFENGLNMNIGYDYRKCIGLKVKPRRGDALLFYSLFTNGTIDKGTWTERDNSVELGGLGEMEKGKELRR
ncbi:uncharacterized protein A4U43_C08F12890 [Asparagus officinalis]|nr:uncharacterized protein A4U43_C08F12890 [Asparagus officinalis]